MVRGKRKPASGPKSPNRRRQLAKGSDRAGPVILSFEDVAHNLITMGCMMLTTLNGYDATADHMTFVARNLRHSIPP